MKSILFEFFKFIKLDSLLNVSYTFCETNELFKLNYFLVSFILIILWITYKWLFTTEIIKVIFTLVRLDIRILSNDLGHV